MKKLIAVLVVGLMLGGCGKDDSGATADDHKIKPVVLESDPVNRGVMAMDAIYASEQAFMQHGMGGIETVVLELQRALVMWPESGNGEGVDACRMALRLHTIRMLNVMDRIDTPVDERSSKFRSDCREAVNYSMDDARIHKAWDILTAQNPKP